MIFLAFIRIPTRSKQVIFALKMGSTASSLMCSASLYTSLSLSPSLSITPTIFSIVASSGAQLWLAFQLNCTTYATREQSQLPSVLNHTYSSSSAHSQPHQYSLTVAFGANNWNTPTRWRRQLHMQLFDSSRRRRIPPQSRAAERKLLRFYLKNVTAYIDSETRSICMCMCVCIFAQVKPRQLKM